jgi:hypothetical protein
MFKDWVYPAYARAMRPRKKPRKRRPTERGQLVLTGALLTAALGMNTESSFVYQLFALLLCIGIASRITLRMARPNVSVRRMLPRYATAEQSFHYRIRITNLGEEPEYDLVIADQPTIKLPDRQQYRTEREPFEESRNAYDRFIGFHRFMYLQRQNTGIAMTPGKTEEIAVKGFTDVEVEARPLRRGIISFSETQVMHQDPMGLNFGLTHFENSETLLVLPKRYRLNPAWQVSGGRNFQPGGITAAWSVGDSDEFVSLRDYRDGDSMRKIHWPSTSKSTARRQMPVVREYQDEFFARNALLLDLSSNNARVIEETIAVASSFALDLQNTDSMLDLIYLTDNGPRIITAGRGTSAVNEQLEALATVQSCRQPFSQLHKAILSHCRLITGCIGVFSTWTPEHESLTHRIMAESVSLRSLVVSDHELSPGPFKTLLTNSIQTDLLTA